MARDRVKTEIATKVLSAIQYATGVVRYTLAEHNVQEVEATSVNELETQVRVKFKNGPPRYFLVKVSEKL
jgi:hypothetical protein